MNMRLLKIIIIALGIAIFTTPSFAHEGHDHGDENTKVENISASLDDFPTLHPLVVHFPIVLLLLAVVSQLAGFFIWKNELGIITIILLAGGLIGAYVSGAYVHPHTEGLNERMQAMLTEHERYASWTNWFSLFALIAKVISHFILKKKWWSEAIVMVLIFLSAYSVSIAGHHGSQMVHIEGIGAKGKYLEQHN